jgi:hypothetical protein
MDSTSPEVEAPALHFNGESDNGKPKVILADDVKDKVRFFPPCSDYVPTKPQISIEMEEIDEEGNPVVSHDEL